MPKTNVGEQITWKEFFKRWKEGIVSITQYQQAKITFRNTWIIVFGIIAGLVISIMNYEDLWWLGIILLGALVNTLVIQIGNYQKLKVLGRFLGDE